MKGKGDVVRKLVGHRPGDKKRHNMRDNGDKAGTKPEPCRDKKSQRSGTPSKRDSGGCKWAKITARARSML